MASEDKGESDEIRKRKGDEVAASRVHSPQIDDGLDSSVLILTIQEFLVFLLRFEG